MRHTVCDFVLAKRARAMDIRAARRRCYWLEETRAQRRAVVRAILHDPELSVRHWLQTSGIEVAIPIIAFLCLFAGVVGR